MTTRYGNSIHCKGISYIQFTVRIRLGLTSMYADCMESPIFVQDWISKCFEHFAKEPCDVKLSKYKHRNA